MCKFIIVDNQVQRVANAQAVLRAMKVDDADVWPAGFRTFGSWDDVYATLVKLRTEGWDPTVKQIVLILDLALDPDNGDYQRGVDELRRHGRTVLADYATVVVSVFNAETLLQGHVDAVHNEPGGYGPDTAASVSAWRRVIEKAVSSWRARTQRDDVSVRVGGVELGESLASRRLELALGAEVLRELGRAISGQATGVRISAESGGYSGSFVVNVSWGASQVVAKVARAKELIVDEAQRWRSAAERAETFGAHVGSMVDSTVSEAGGRNAVYYVIQTRIVGNSLERWALDDGAVPLGNDEGVIGQVVDLGSLGRNERSTRAGTDVLPFSLIDRARFCTSLPRLMDIQNVLREECDASLGIADEEAMSLQAIAEDWATVLKKAGCELIGCTLQHGDLTPRNVLIDSSGGLRLIDFARFGQWPCGYDVTRMELQVWLRCIARRMERDVGMGWVKACYAAMRGSGVEAEVGAVRDIQNRRTKMLRRAIGIRRKALAVRDECGAGMHMCRLYDALKMCSYEDVSWFKRLVFLWVARDAGREAGVL